MESLFGAAGQKLLAFRRELRACAEGDLAAPVAVEVHLSERCGHACPDCQGVLVFGRVEGRRRARTGAHLDLSLLASMWEAPPRGLILSGHTGDPLLHPEVESFLWGLAGRRVPTVLITNGEALSPPIAEAAVAACTGIRVSLDAANASQHRRTHGGAASWERVLAGVRALVEARSRAGVPSSRCRIGVGYLTDASAALHMVAATELARNLRVDYIQFRPFHGRATGLREELARCRAMETASFSVLASTPKYDRAADPSRSYDVCDAASFFAVIDARADVYLCCHHVGRPEARYGSLAERPWAEIIRDPERRAVMGRFPRESCVPLCRLHDHNETLHRLRAQPPPKEFVSVERLRRHSVFL